MRYINLLFTYLLTPETVASRHFHQQDMTVPSILQLGGCNKKLLAGYSTVVAEADKHFFAACSRNGKCSLWWWMLIIGIKTLACHFACGVVTHRRPRYGIQLTTAVPATNLSRVFYNMLRAPDHRSVLVQQSRINRGRLASIILANARNA